MQKFIDRDFNSGSGEYAIANFKPEVIAAAIEELGYQYAIANQSYEQAKHEAEKIFATLTKEYKKVAGSVSGAEAMAKASDRYQYSLGILRDCEAEKIKAQSSFKAAEGYSKMAITKVSSEAKMAEFYRKGNLT